MEFVTVKQEVDSNDDEDNNYCKIKNILSSGAKCEAFDSNITIKTEESQFKKEVSLDSPFEHVFIKEPNILDDVEHTHISYSNQSGVRKIKEETEVVNLHADVEFTAEYPIKSEDPENCLGLPLFEDVQDSMESSNVLGKERFNVPGPEEDFRENCPYASVTKDEENPPADGTSLQVKAPSRTYIGSRRKRAATDDYIGKQKVEIKCKKVEDLTEPCVQKDTLSNTIQESKEDNTSIITNRYSSVYIDLTDNNKLKVYDKRHECTYCKKRFLNMTKHFMKEHKSKEDISLVKRAFPLSPAKTRQVIRVSRLGNFQHNVRVLNKKSIDELIVLRQSVSDIGKFPRDEFLPCPECVGFIHQSRLKSHHRKCLLKPSEAEQIKLKRKLFKESRSLLLHGVALNSIHSYVLSLFKEQVLDKLTSTLGNIATSDSTIYELGQHLASIDVSVHNFAFVRTVMLKMGCLLQSCRRLSGNLKLQFHTLLIPKNVLLILHTLKVLSITKDGSSDNLYTFYSLFPQICDCVFLLRGKWLLNGYLSQSEKFMKFYYLFVQSYEKNMVDTLIKKGNGLYSELCSSLPLTSLVMQLKNSLTNKVVLQTNHIKSLNMTVDITGLWYDLAEATLALLCLYNPVFFKIIEQIKISEYAVRPDWTIDNLEDYKSRLLTIPYLFAAKRCILCTKNNGIEYVILFTKEIKQAIDVLISRREQASVSEHSPFIFAMQHFDRISAFKAANCFYNCCVKSGGLPIDILNDLKKREYVAYITQLADMSQEEIEWIRVNFLPLTMDCKKNRNPLVQAVQVFEITKVVMENKEEIEIENNSLNKETQTEVHLPNKVVEVVQKNLNHELLTIDGGPLKNKMSDWEIELVLDYFKEEIRNNKIVTRASCLRCMKKIPVLRYRNWKEIKDCVVKDMKTHKSKNPLYCDYESTFCVSDDN